jgi:hypothetical protein
MEKLCPSTSPEEKITVVLTDGTTTKDDVGLFLGGARREFLVTPARP